MTQRRPGRIGYASQTTERKDRKHMLRTQNESAVEAALVRGVRRLGGRADKLVSAIRGIPDRIVLLPGGRVFLVELKDERGVLSPLQELYHTHCAELGTEVVVLRGTEDVNRWIARQERINPDGHASDRVRAPRWTEEDDRYVLDTIDSDESDDDVARRLDRTVEAIRGRRRRLLALQDA